MGSKPVGISASRAAAILGLGEYEGQTVFTVWQQIMEERFPPNPLDDGFNPEAKRGEPGYVGFNVERGYVLPPPVDNAAVRFGTAFEDAIVELAVAAQGCGITDREMPFSLIDQEMEYVTCHVDGRYSAFLKTESGMTKYKLHEGKTTTAFTFWDAWGTPGTDRVPQGYQVQTQHQMLCTGAAEDIVSVLVFPRRPDEWEAEGLKVVGGPTTPGKAWSIITTDPRHWWDISISEWARVLAEMGLFHQYPVAASPTLQRTLVDCYRHFWATYVLPEREPEIDCYADIRRAFPQPVGTVVATDVIERWAAEYKALGEEISDTGRIGRRREELKLLLVKYMREADRAIDEESREKTVLRDRTGKKIAQFNGKTFR